MKKNNILEKKSILFHKKNKGKIEMCLKKEIRDGKDLSIVYTPGVAGVCKVIKKNRQKAYLYTMKNNCVAVISDGTAVLGLGDIGPEAAIPVMEGKCAIFKKFAGIDAFPICLDEKDPKKIIKTIKIIAPVFAGINLEDISAPRCFEIEKKLIQRLKMPVFHDDQHGTAIVVLAGLINALKIVEKKIEKVKIVINGAGAAGYAITKILYLAGARNIVILDSKGVINKNRDYLYPHKKDLLKFVLRAAPDGKLKDALERADVFIGVSKGNILKKRDVLQMNKRAIVFALANPTPEINPKLAHEAGAEIIATGRSDFPNQLNNALVFPGFFKGLLDGKISKVTNGMKVSAAYALASLVKKPAAEKIVPSIFDKRVVEAVAKAVKNSHR